jgi:hypothetical protein
MSELKINIGYTAINDRLKLYRPDHKNDWLYYLIYFPVMDKYLFLFTKQGNIMIPKNIYNTYTDLDIVAQNISKFITNTDDSCMILNNEENINLIDMNVKYPGRLFFNVILGTPFNGNIHDDINNYLLVLSCMSVNVSVNISDNVPDYEFTYKRKMYDIYDVLYADGMRYDVVLPIFIELFSQQLEEQMQKKDI